MEYAGIIVSGLTLICVIILIFKKNDLSLLKNEIDANKQDILQNIATLQGQIQAEIKNVEQEILNNLLPLREQIEAQSEEIQLHKHLSTINTERILTLLNYNDPNLAPQASHWILENEKFKKVFTPGKLERVTSEEGSIELQYEYEDENIICSKYVDGVLTTKTVLNQFSVPIMGYLYDVEGNVIKEFTYDSLGRVTSSEQ